MTLKDLFDHWKLIADRQSYDIMKEEVESFVKQAKAAGITYKELLAQKERIMNVWTAPTWKLAKEEHAHWNNKEWYEKQRVFVKDRIGRVVKEQYAEEIAAAKTTSTQDSVKKPTQPVDDGIPTFNNLKDFQAWKARKLGGGL